MYRLVVERWTHGDAIDMTWATFWGIVAALPRAKRIDAGKGLTHAEEAADDMARRQLEV